MSKPTVIRIVEWPYIALLGACVALMFVPLGVVLIGRVISPAPTTTPITVQLGPMVLECSLYEDRVNHVKSLSC